jgi:hypothetical protein
VERQGFAPCMYRVRSHMNAQSYGCRLLPASTYSATLHTAMVNVTHTHGLWVLFRNRRPYDKSSDLFCQKHA